MEGSAEFDLLKSNLQKVEDKFISFFEAGNVRWPGEPHDLLRNHYKHFDNISAKMMTWEKLGLTDLPENITKEVKLAFEAFLRREEYR
jgi:hypothetical protein